MAAPRAFTLRDPGGRFTTIDNLSTLLGDDTQYRTIRAWLSDQGSHPYEATIASFRPVTDRDWYVFSVTCLACEHTWDSHIEGNALWSARASWAFVNDWLAPFLRSVASAPCFKLTMFAELAEWITERVREAGPIGITYSELLSMAVREHLCAPSDVDVVLERLGFLPKGAIYVPASVAEVEIHGSRLVLRGDMTVKLPEDHPDHPGNSHNCVGRTPTCHYEWED